MQTKKSGEFKLLNSDDHAQYITKMKKTPADYRPDIAHYTLLTLLDSPLNKAGLLKVYLHTSKNVLVDISSHIRIPRTFKRFAGLMVQLLHTRKIKSSENNESLMKVIKNPVTDHLPAGCIKIGLSVEGDLVNIHEFIRKPELNLVSDDPNVEPKVPVFVLGACAHGHPGKEADYKDMCISVSNYHMSAAMCAARITGAFEEMWGIV